LAIQYYPMISERLLDRGISVRRRAVRILGDLCLKDSTSVIVPQICSKLVGRISDEESIKDLVLKLFQELWFCERTKSNTENELSSIEIATRASQIMSVVTSSQSHEWLVEMLSRLNDKGGHLSMICSKRCVSLIETMLSIEERRSSIENQEEYVSRSNQMMSCAATLGVFCAASPSLLVRHIAILQPYLNASVRAS